MKKPNPALLRKLMKERSNPDKDNIRLDRLYRDGAGPLDEDAEDAFLYPKKGAGPISEDDLKQFLDGPQKMPNPAQYLPGRYEPDAEGGPRTMEYRPGRDDRGEAHTLEYRPERDDYKGESEPWRTLEYKYGRDGPRPGAAKGAEDAFDYADVEKNELEDKIRDMGEPEPTDREKIEAIQEAEKTEEGSPNVAEGFDFKQFMADQLNGLMGEGDEPEEPAGTMYPIEGEDLNPDRVPEPQGMGPHTETDTTFAGLAESGPAASHLGGGHEGASTKDILSGKVPLTMDALGLPDYDMPELETGADGTAGSGWRNADLKPLPGEETLHEDIRKWADTDRTAGGDGMQRLRQAYMEDVEAGQLGRDSIGFQEWLESKGFDPYNEMGYRGNRKILNEIAPMDTIESDDPDQAHRSRLRRDRVVNSYLQKYGGESLAGGLSREDAEAIYDDAAARALENGENPVLAAGRALKGASGSLQYDKDAQLRANVTRRSDQNNRAQRFGVPVGLIGALDQFGDAQTPAEAQEALMMGSMMYPNWGMNANGVGIFKALSEQVVNGQIGLAQAQAELAKATGKDTAGTDGDSPYTKSLDMQLVGKLGFTPEAIASFKQGAGWADKEYGDQLRSLGNTFSKPLSFIRNQVEIGQGLPPAGKAMIRDIFGDHTTPSIDDMKALFGPMDEETYELMLAEITGEATRTWKEAGEDAADSVGGFFDGAKSFFEGLTGLGG